MATDFGKPTETLDPATTAPESRSSREPLPAQSPAVLTGAIQFDLPSAITERVYRIYVAVPDAPAPPAGYPVVIVNDGNGLFGTAAMQMTLGRFDGLHPAIIVGVGYPVTDLLQTFALRTLDLTPPTPTDKIPPYLTTGPDYQDATFGGAELFYRFLVEELRPTIAAAYPTDFGDQTLFGDSLGGLFTLHVLFNHPNAFRTYVAASPSIWWNDCAVLKGETAFRNLVEAGRVAPRVLITVGGLEQSTADLPAVSGAAREAIVKLITDARMVDNARELAGRLSAIESPEGALIRFHEFADETHQSVIPASISRAIGFALKPSPSARELE
ncbi:hypothetical protein CVO77_00810 [Sphingopyxis lindanitolerans]|uniref:Esterase n=1 Tax=Sphingopyxis lindanitolerans TaxID=2054227 RepID=A0A2S8BB85_9SPHN|nr:alpha/beta hydrolase-fold protein [Sphingopyxis lindanitolerans]PQM29499.1 hypothetical protein CVO77_00810 [Sphingopyxis lindanitolerans]